MGKREDLVDQIGDPDLLFMDGFDDAIIGYTAHQPGRATVPVYDQSKILAELMRQGCTYEEAVEYYEFNIIGAWVGPGTPVVVAWLDTDELGEELAGALALVPNPESQPS